MTAKHLRDVPLAGMNVVLAGAASRGFTPGDPRWVNLGQGQPEIGDIPGAPPRIARIELDAGDHAYGPVNGTRELRQAVAEHYNRLYRKGKSSRYTAEHVAIVGGGRPALNRAVAALGSIDVGYMLPDYAAYEDILDRNTPRIRPVALGPDADDLVGADAAAIVDAISGSGLPALLISNPRNPTGQVIAGSDLGALVTGTTKAGCALLIDEFYSQYVYNVGLDATGASRSLPAEPVSAAAHIENVDTDPVLVFDGLTKGFRYPGWRLGWVLGPIETIAAIERIGQAMDGGPSQVVQRAALAALEPGYADAETAAVRAHFAGKRDVMVDGLRAAGIRVDGDHRQRGSFYVWGSLDDLPEPLRDADAFFREALDQRVITVPGYVFDLNPGGHRATGVFDRFVRFSYGPPADAVADGVARLVAVVDGYR